MDLEAVKKAKAMHDDSSPEAKAHLNPFVAQVVRVMKRELPALPDSDLAAVSWYIADLVETLRRVEVGAISPTLKTTAEAYEIATVDLLGWLE